MRLNTLQIAASSLLTAVMLGCLTRSRWGDMAAECDLKHLLASRLALQTAWKSSIDTEAGFYRPTHKRCYIYC